MLKVIRFSAEWCSPCKLLGPVFSSLQQENADVEFETVDIDEKSELAVKYNISAVPIVVFEKDGGEVDRLIGLHQKTEYQRKIGAYK